MNEEHTGSIVEEWRETGREDEGVDEKDILTGTEHNRPSGLQRGDFLAVDRDRLSKRVFGTGFGGQYHGEDGWPGCIAVNMIAGF